MPPITVSMNFTAIPLRYGAEAIVNRFGSREYSRSAALAPRHETRTGGLIFDLRALTGGTFREQPFDG